ncbi:precorrin-3B C17-methyltransferase [Humidesulfovibrio mexicanus]|uniref:Precorrin-3B C17-methyltransferase n=1 Tax=Humidesulfovibrio mexicanus TaxID=147047 RepID=A0A238YE51_9BACT|nr:precorrin-3B C(17)-methyltransferase [Humidesulfovibrio mexicanus]SNR68884.1 precorrin-3B C17-methyltransferase [Humidesulfovibrio mexicanus]
MNRRITVVGLGPGDAALLPPMARQALLRARAIVGYKGYIGLLEPELLEGRQVLSTGMTGEVERCNAAIDLAVSGVETAVVSSGDAGVYAMAGLVLELLEARGLLGQVDFEVVPGIPALCAAAALLGAPLMHDFAVVSLSDLLTPWEQIERRLAAAAGADFVVVLYNPRSGRRTDQLPRALELLRAHKPGGTPVGLVKRAFRPGQEILATTLDALDPQAVDMQSIVLVGNASTRLVGGRLLTPRGYAGKYALAGGAAAPGS